eukprot:COSAG01_NODE_11984_length_1822_cov_4.208358_2_plen_153_part_00
MLHVSDLLVVTPTGNTEVAPRRLDLLEVPSEAAANPSVGADVVVGGGGRAESSERAETGRARCGLVMIWLANNLGDVCRCTLASSGEIPPIQTPLPLPLLPWASVATCLSTGVRLRSAQAKPMLSVRICFAMLRSSRSLLTALGCGDDGDEP